ncbi:MAG: hypothetical protein K2N64_05560 [Anaeroplasmataceae bacterium]|nr:hypothetical protein [Anaeroplasmataceae bacterium]
MKKLFLLGSVALPLILAISCTQNRFKESNLDVSFSEDALQACHLSGLPEIPFTSSYLAEADKLYFNCKEIKSWNIDVLEWLEEKEDIVFWGQFAPAQFLLFSVTVDKYETLENYILSDHSLFIAFTTMEFLDNQFQSFQNCFIIEIRHLDESKKIKSKEKNYYFWYEMRIYEHHRASMFHPSYEYRVEE